MEKQCVSKEFIDAEMALFRKEFKDIDRYYYYNTCTAPKLTLNIKNMVIVDQL